MKHISRSITIYFEIVVSTNSRWPQKNNVQHKRKAENKNKNKAKKSANRKFYFKSQCNQSITKENVNKKKTDDITKNAATSIAIELVFKNVTSM